MTFELVISFKINYSEQGLQTNIFQNIYHILFDISYYKKNILTDMVAIFLNFYFKNQKGLKDNLANNVFGSLIIMKALV